MRDMRINAIFEGSSEIMRLFLAREAMDPHLKAAGEAVNTRLPMSRRAKAAMKAAGFYAFWYPKQWLPLGGVDTTGMHSQLAKQVRYVKKTSRKLARRMYHAMLANGPKLEQKQITLARFVEIGTELFAIAASATRAQQLINQGKDAKHVLALVDHFCRESKIRIDDRFRGLKKNADSQGYKLAQSVLANDTPWLSDFVVTNAYTGKERPEAAKPSGASQVA